MEMLTTKSLLHREYPEAFLLISLDLIIQVFQSVGEAAVGQVFADVFVCPLHSRRHLEELLAGNSPEQSESAHLHQTQVLKSP